MPRKTTESPRVSYCADCAPPKCETLSSLGGPKTCYRCGVDISQFGRWVGDPPKDFRDGSFEVRVWPGEKLWKFRVNTDRDFWIPSSQRFRWAKGDTRFAAEAALVKSDRLLAGRLTYLKREI